MALAQHCPGIWNVLEHGQDRDLVDSLPLERQAPCDVPLLQRDVPVLAVGDGDIEAPASLGLVVMALEKAIVRSASPIGHRVAACDERVDLAIAQTVDDMLDDVV